MGPIHACAARVQPAGRAGGLRIAAPAGEPAAQSRKRLAAVSPDSAFNTAISFATNTNWQGYGGETHHELSHPDARADGAELPLRGHGHGGAGRADPRLRAPEHADHRQLLGGSDAQHAVHPAAAVAGAGAGAGVARAWCRPSRLQDGAAGRIGRVRQAQARRRRPAAEGRQGQSGHREGDAKEQVIAVGPAASQIAIKQLGTNGGGFFNVNSAHPFENPTPLSQLPRDAGDPADPGGAVLHLRADGRATRARAGRCWRR